MTDTMLAAVQPVPGIPPWLHLARRAKLLATLNVGWRSVEGVREGFRCDA
jgi:hypothetical protein